MADRSAAAVPMNPASSGAPSSEDLVHTKSIRSDQKHHHKNTWCTIWEGALAIVVCRGGFWSWFWTRDNGCSANINVATHTNVINKARVKQQELKGDSWGRTSLQDFNLMKSIQFHEHTEDNTGYRHQEETKEVEVNKWRYGRNIHITNVRRGESPWGS